MTNSRSFLSGLGNALSFSKISGIYVILLIVLLFGLWIPETFLTKTTAIDVAGSQAVTAILTLGLLFPLAAGAYDLSIGAMLGLASLLSASLVAHGMSTGEAILISLAVGAAVGVLNGILIVGIKINSFIATLGVSSILLAITSAISNNQQIIGLPDFFENIGQTRPFDIPIPVFYLIVLALLAWYVLEHTPFGRNLFAIGGKPEAARLAGVRSNLYMCLALVICSVSAAFAGVVLTATLGAGSPEVGANYLLPAYAAAFLGATQIKPGRFNVFGTLIAVYLLAIGVKGLQLSGAAFWIPQLFNGTVLILAVGLSLIKERPSLPWRRRSERGSAETANPTES